MSKELKAILLINFIKFMVSPCDGVMIPKLDGRVMVYAFTPFKPNGDVNVQVVPQIAEYLAKRHIKNVHIMGFYGEGPTLGLESRKALTSAWLKETECLKMNLIVEIGAMPFPDQLEMAKFCSIRNVSAISAIPVLVYEAKTVNEIVKDYQQISDAAPNIPLFYRAIVETGPQITPAEAVVALVNKVKTFAGAALAIDSALDVLAALPSIAGFQIWIFGSKTIAPALAMNMNVSVTHVPNLCPKAVIQIDALIKEGKIKEALDLQQKLNRLYQEIVSNHGEIIAYNSRSFMKYIRATFQIFTNMDLGERFPFDKANSTELDKIRCNLRKFKDFINCYCS